MARSNPNDDPLKKLQAMVMQNYVPSFTSGSNTTGSSWTTYSSSYVPFPDGTRIVLLDGRGRDDGIENNPIWGRDGEYIAGIVKDAHPDGRGAVIHWDNGRMNYYEFKSARLIELENAPKPKNKWGKKVDLDATKLDNLIIDPKVKTEIVALLQQHKHAKKLFDEWGLAEVIEYGRGMTMLFWGQPGTGKTFGARCIAKALGKELLIISSAEIESSEPGGANRNIQNAFATASEENKILFIDECDSLIANRNELGMILSSQVNTLLTEIEKCESVVILATNKVEHMDPALERRMSLIIEFPEPNKDQRFAIWKGLLPAKMPLGEDVIVEELSDKKFTGGLIKNIVLQAARLAISDGADKVSKTHFERAMDRTKSSQNLMGKKRIQHDGMSRGAGVDKIANINKFLES